MSDSHPFPTEDNHFQVRYQLWLGLLFLLLGAITTLLNLWIMLLEGSFSGGIVVGVVITIVGFLYLTRPYFAIAPNRLTIYNLIGSAIKRYPFESFSHLKVESNKLYIETGQGNKEKIKIAKWMVRSSDWKRLEMIAHQPVPTHP